MNSDNNIIDLVSIGIIGIGVYIYTSLNPNRENPMSTYFFVVRDTDHPEEDLKRNWSSFAGGSVSGESGGSTEEEAKEEYASFLGIEPDEVDVEFRYHPAYDKFVAVHYDGLGAFTLDSETLEDAIKEADEYQDQLAVTTEAGDGHFYANQVVSFHKVREGRYIFELKA